MFPPEWRPEAWRGVPILRYAFPNMALDGSAREPPGRDGPVHVDSDGVTHWPPPWQGPPPNDEDLPDLLLVDDLSGNPAFADAAARRAFVRELHALRSMPACRTVIYATREGDDALAVSDQIAVLDGGQIVQCGTPAEVYDAPVNEDVARLFGRPPAPRPSRRWKLRTSGITSTSMRASQWRDQFLAAGQAGLKSRALDARDAAHRRLQAKIGELLMENELLYAKVAPLEAGVPLARRRSTPRADRRRPGRRPGRPHPPGARGLAVSWRRIPESLGEAAGRGGPHREGARAPIDARTPPPGSAPRGPRAWPGGARRHDHPAAPDVMWGTDMTATVTVAEGAACVFVAVDHCTTECIGLHAAKSGSRFEALEPIRQGIQERCGGIGEGVARGLRLRHDHGSNYLADDFQQEIAFFGIESSPSFVREPEGHGVAERFIRTLKENLLWVRSFETIEELRLALLEFKRTYNEQWMLEKYAYRSPAQVRRDLVGLDAAA